MDQNNFIYVFDFNFHVLYAMGTRESWETSVTVDCVQKGLIIVPNEH